MTALLPIGRPMSSPRRVSMIGVKGWYSANQRSAGRHRAGRDEAAAEERQQQQEHRAGCWRSRRSWLTRPRATDSQVSAKLIMREDADRGEPLGRAGGGPEPDQRPRRR